MTDLFSRVARGMEIERRQSRDKEVEAARKTAALTAFFDGEWRIWRRCPLLDLDKQRAYFEADGYEWWWWHYTDGSDAFKRRDHQCNSLASTYKEWKDVLLKKLNYLAALAQEEDQRQASKGQRGDMI